MKTKMIVVVVLAAMCVLPLSAQVKVGVEGGMNLSHYLVSGSDGYKAEQVGGMKPGFQLGVTVDYEIGKHWMLMSGLSWLQNRSTMKMMDHMVTYFPKTEIKMNNLILPLKMGYNIRVSDKLSLIPSVGVYASYGFGAGNCSLDVIHQLPSLQNGSPWMVFPIKPGSPIIVVIFRLSAVGIMGALLE